MLTPNQIKNHSFQNNKEAYQVQEVDAYINEIVMSYEQMFKENKELLGKLEQLAQAVEEYHAEEDQIKDALIVAQKMANQIKTEAEKKADALLSEARQQAEDLTRNATDEANTLLQDAKTRSEATLDSSEVTANDVIEGAKVLANNVISQAKFSSEEIIANAKIEVELYQTIINETKSQAAAFKAELLEHYQNHIQMIDEIPDQAAKALEEKIAMAPKKQVEVESETSPAAIEEMLSESVPVEMQEKQEIAEVAEVADADTDEAAVTSASVAAFIVPPVQDNADIPYSAPPIEAPMGAGADEVPAMREAFGEFEDVYSGDVDDEEDEMLSAPKEAAKIPLDSPTHKMKFGEDYDVTDDDDEYDDDEADHGFKGFFRRKK